ncbi:hypothetical protein C0J52_25177 [Blattella germanica]|nr:hypothetical protein C0J52_25177 [Blattella germanica]
MCRLEIFNQFFFLSRTIFSHLEDVRKVIQYSFVHKYYMEIRNKNNLIVQIIMLHLNSDPNVTDNNTYLIFKFNLCSFSSVCNWFSNTETLFL